MPNLTLHDRSVGALVGAFIGDALGMGVHWYYDLDEMHRDHGDWVSGYTHPVAGRYHEGLKAGDLTQAGYILKLMMQSVVESRGYDEDAFCRKLDNDLFAKLNGDPMDGPGGYTSQSMRAVYQQRKAGIPWPETGSSADTTEAIERTIALGVLHSNDLRSLAQDVASNTNLTQRDELVVSLTVAFNAVLALLLQGKPLDENITDILFELVKSGALPFHTVTSEKLQPPAKGSAEPPRAHNFSSPDALITPSTCAAAAADASHIRIEPAYKVSLVYGMPCAIYHILPAAYYLAARFTSDFESAVLHAVNGGGQNCARAMLTGALVGAQVGLSGIPPRLVDGLTEKEELVKLANDLADLVKGGPSA
ncbi:ADP-ribosylation/Crystallin J1 [Leptomonas seymouri]|uniref:ADP-ribosylhydrolase ARH3 n=1 Tax=Leptomonas seymouri TaxID=5684 RepID=A0A0N1PEA9_LEPSE|nr:ADP-ribosylation/Crystallin J1 [Leptomonas seymouri]|eukprot:KPI88620.1 ADP-ribosylation/Crystallin J1 [Leptomonas seymouri]